MTPQTLTAIGAIVVFGSGILASRGIISKETADYIGSPETLAVLGTIITTGLAAWGLWKQRPKALVASVANTPGVQAVIADPEIANSKATPGNVVTSATEAARLPGVPR